MPSGHGISEISLLKTPFEHNRTDQQVRKFLKPDNLTNLIFYNHISFLPAVHNPFVSQLSPLDTGLKCVLKPIFE